MRNVLTGNRVPVKLWLDDLEEGAGVQAGNLANLPFAFKHIAIMPDAHQGYGMPIGGVLATEGVVIPNAVGVDIGCGVCAAETSLSADKVGVDTLKAVLADIRGRIPTGFSHHKVSQPPEWMPLLPENAPVCRAQYESACRQLGTLGGGNHFIEIQKASNNRVWVMIHSGSRNLGLKVATHYNGVAVKHNAKSHLSVPKSHHLAFLPMDTGEGRDYLAEMGYCVRFAQANRELMMTRLLDILAEKFPELANVQRSDIIDVAHNYVAMENHFGQNVMVHRKGATRAYEGEVGIIPGSQGTRSYIVTGKGNPESFRSCSHGAGRRMGRKQAQRQLDLEEEQKRMEGILHAVRGPRDLDEAPGAYKNIEEVMENQSDLVTIREKLIPMAVVKG